MDHCALVEVLYYALCGITGGRRWEPTGFPTMIRVMEGYEVFGSLQLKRIDWRQEMFKEEEELEREHEQGLWGQSGMLRQLNVRVERQVADSLWTWTTKGRKRQSKLRK